MWLLFLARFEYFFFCTYSHARTGMRERRNGLCGCLKGFVFFWFARTATHVLAHESEGTACVVVVSGTRFESFFLFFFVRTATHVRARESEGTACVVVVSGTQFESFFYFILFFAHTVRARTYGPALVYIKRRKHAPSLPPSLAAIFTLKSAARKASVTIMSCLFVSIYVYVYVYNILLRILARPACDRPLRSNGDRLAHRHGQFCRSPSSLTLESSYGQGFSPCPFSSAEYSYGVG